MTPVEFLRELFAEDELIELRPIADKKGGRPNMRARRWFRGPAAMIDALPEVLTWARETRHAVFFGVLPRSSEGGRKADIAPGRVVWADMDEHDYDGGMVEIHRRLESTGRQPSILVHSGHGLHAYWLLSEVASAGALEAASRTMAKALGADHCFDAARLLRLPGSVNQKDPEHPRDVRVVWADPGRRYTLTELVDGLPVVPAGRERPPATADEQGWTMPPKGERLPEDLQRLIDNSPQLRDLRASRGRPPKDADGRELDLSESGYDYAYVQALVRAGVTEPELLARALDQRAQRSGRTLADDYVRRTIKNAAGKVREHAHRKRPPATPPGTWDKLAINRHGNPEPSLRNVATVLREESPPGGELWWDEFGYQVMIGDRPLTDADEVTIAIWLDEVWLLKKISPSTVHQVAEQVAHSKARHPVREYLDGLEWDGEGRCARWLIDYFGAEDTELNEAIGRCWLTSAVARAYEPGCKVDTVLILYGGQGIGKSTALAALAQRPEWFSDTAVNLRNKDAYGALQGIWIYEMAELDSMRRSDTEAMKAFLTSRVDRYRPAYGRNTVSRPRGGVIVGTTNRLSFLSDATGNRRFWPVSIGDIDLKSLQTDASMLWAEAVQWYRTGARWWLDDAQHAALEQLNARHVNADGWEPLVERWLTTRIVPFTVTDALIDCIEKDPAQIAGADTARMVRLLQAAGCTSMGKRRIGGQIGRWWKAPAEIIPLGLVADD